MLLLVMPFLMCDLYGPQRRYSSGRRSAAQGGDEMNALLHIRADVAATSVVAFANSSVASTRLMTISSPMTYAIVKFF